MTSKEQQNKKKIEVIAENNQREVVANCDHLSPTFSVQETILTLRGQQVILDSDLATLYGVETKRLNEQVRQVIPNSV